jgi:acetyltransferase
MTIRNLDALLEAKSVVLIGASERPGSVGATIARNLMVPSFEGRVYFVSPTHEHIFGRPCHPSVAALPEATDLAVIATPPASVPDLARELAVHGNRAIVVITAGLDADAKLAVLEAGRTRLVRVLGPNCIGVMLPRIGLDASFSHCSALPGELAFLSQSGALVTAVVDWATSRRIGFSHVISLGDMADVDFGDLLDYLAVDTKSRAILLYMEAVTNASKFMSAARRAARVKPVIAIKAGRHATSARAAASHTGRLAGNDAAYDAAFRRAGILRVTALEELFEAAEILARIPRLTGERLMILTNGGGAGVLAADHLADEHGTLAELSPTTRERLDRSLPPTWSKANPVDIIGDAGPKRYAEALEAVLSDPNCDAVLAINCPTALASSTDIARQALTTWRNTTPSKPLVTNWLGDGAATEARRIFAEAGVATFQTPAAAVRGFMQLVRRDRGQRELMRTPPAMPREETPRFDLVQATIDRALAANRSLLTEVEGKTVLEAYGIPVVPTIPVDCDTESIGAAAERLLGLHERLALKILSDDISHKSDVGGVHLGLGSIADVAAAATAMLKRVHAVRPDARIAGFTLSPMIVRPHARELLVGMSVDPTFGPIIMFGAGGTAVEVIADTALALPPLDLQLARDLIARTRIANLLKGFRDRQPADLDAIARSLVLVSSLVCRHPEIRELDINPLLADGNGVIALDARMRVADVRRYPRTPLAIAPYPREWERQESLPDFGSIDFRPIRPEDEALYATFLSRVTPEDFRLRMFAPQKAFSHEFLARLTQIDYAREMAFVALSTVSGELLGVSRFAADPDYLRGEYAVLVRSDLKGRGLGWALMHQLIDYARATGIREIFGSVLAVNANMLKMCRELGFTIELDPDDAALRCVRLDLTKPSG